MLSFKDLRIEKISLNTSCISVSKNFLAYRERQSSFALLDFSTLLSVALSLDDFDWCGFVLFCNLCSCKAVGLCACSSGMDSFSVTSLPTTLPVSSYLALFSVFLFYISVLKFLWRDLFSLCCCSCWRCDGVRLWFSLLISILWLRFLMKFFFRKCPCSFIS